MTQFTKLVDEKFTAAKEKKALFSIDAIQAEKESGGIKFEITCAPALAKKPTNEDKSQEKVNPFLNPNPDLVVKELDEHLILLNKFAVIPNHLLLVTKEQKSQEELLLPNDLYETYKILQEFGSPLLAFYNCGKNSGASQAHKHIQLVPLNGKNGVQPPIKKLYDQIHDRRVGQIYAMDKLPFVHVIMQLDTNIIRAATKREDLTDYLSQMFFGLLDAMFQQLRENAQPMNTSYNFLMTEEFMMLIPREKEKVTISHDNKDYEFSLNSLAFAGMLLCKSEEQLEAMKAQDDLMDILVQVAIKWNPDAQRLDTERQLGLKAHLA